MRDEDESLEQSGTKKEPDLKIILNELRQASADSGMYMDRMVNVRGWWMDEWAGQTIDGRMWASSCGKKSDQVFPWDGCSDSRLRIVSTIVQEHVTLALTAFWSAKVQAKSIRPFVQGEQSSIAQKMLDWRIYTQMKRELLRELPLAFNWKFAGGLSFIGVTWEQQRELAYVPIKLDDIAKLTQAMGIGDMVDKILDPDKAYDDELVGMLQSFSPVLPKDEARNIITDLRNIGYAELPITQLRVNKPKWVAKRPLVDVLFPSETSDIQQARWVNEPERVSESELIDRIETDGYDPDFVDKALTKKGVFSSWMSNVSHDPTTLGGDRDMVELHHFVYQTVHQGVPCKYKCIFNEATIGVDNLFAVHRKFEYDHQQYPVVALRRSHYYRPLLTSIGIAEEAYTDEWDLKRQQDGLNNRTDLIHAPPMVVPTLRANATQNAYGPRAVMTAMRPESIVWQPLPPLDNTPVLVMEMIQNRMDRRYAIIGGAVDPEIKAMRRQHLGTDVLGEMELVVEQTYQLMQQYETDADIQRVAGGEPWNYSAKDIQGQYEISATVDMKMIDLAYAEIKLDMLAKMLPFREAGGTVFNSMAQIIDPDLADALGQDQASPVAMEKEKTDEYNAIGQILSGVEARKPMMAMNQLRLQTIQEILMDQMTMQKVQQDPVAQKRLQNRVEFFQNQIQQYQQNPQIGRALSATTFGNKAPAITNAQQ